MLKQLISACIISIIGLCSMAAESTMVFTYASDEVGEWGKGKSETYDVAIRINDPALVGKNIVSIRALINATEGVENTSLWLSKELTLEKGDNGKVNVPDTYSQAVLVETVNGESGISYGQLSTSLSTPYELTADGIYVGYTLTVPEEESLSEMQQNPLLLSPSNHSESLYIRASKDFLKWMPYNEKLGAAAVIYVTIEGEFPESSVSIDKLTDTFALVDEVGEIKAEIFNNGSQPVESIDYEYTLNGESQEAHFELTQPMAPDFVYPTAVYLPIEAVNESGIYTLDLTITKVNGKDNNNMAATSIATLTVVPYAPIHRPLIEEFTGTWCSWCPRGYIALEMLNETFGDGVVLAAYHSNSNGMPDPMVVTDTYPLSVSGFPSASFNRNGLTDPYYGSNNEEFGIKYDVIDCINTVVPADIRLDAVWANDEQTEITVTTKARFFENKENAGYKIGYLLINNGLSGEGPSWNQSNVYCQYKDKYAGTPLEVLTTWGLSVSGLVFNDVVVDVTGMMGIEDSLPTDIIFNEENINNFSIDIASNNVIQDKGKLYVVTYIINPDGTILNANKAQVVSSAGVNSVNSDASEISAEYYNIAGSRVAAPENGVFVKVAKMSDGTIRASKVVR